MRFITGHQVPGAAIDITIEATDQPGAGGAHQRYIITGEQLNMHRNPSSKFGDGVNQTVILFQNGPVPVNGINGVTVEALLAICADRLECFQAGPFPAEDNQLALEKIYAALETLHNRTRNRIARSVEGVGVV